MFIPAARAAPRAARRGVRLLRRRSAVRSYLESVETPKLHLGAGHNHLDGWLNTDRDPASGAIHLDVAEPFPFADATFHYAFSEHLVEHLPYGTASAMLAEAPGARPRRADPCGHPGPAGARIPARR